MITLRPYQIQAIEAARAYLKREPKGCPLISVPTGGGKGLMAAEMLRSTHSKGNRAIYLTMSKELVAQTMDDLTRLAPEVAFKSTIACAELGPVDLTGDIVLGTPQSVFRRLNKIGERDLIIVDECQMIPRSDDSMYGKIFKRIPKVRVGLTATPFRLDTGRLDEGEGAPFTKTVYNVPTSELQKKGHLCKLIYRKAHMEVSIENVHIKRGDYVLSELEQYALNEQLCADIATDMAASFASDKRNSAIMFCVSIEHARMMAAALRVTGLRAEHVSSESDKTERNRVISGTRDGSIQVMCCVQVGMIGFNVPRIDMVAWARPTASTGLWIQGCGRGLRPFAGKANCMIRDYAGNIFRHGPVEDVERGAVKRGDDRAKLCIHCEAVVSRSAVKCPECGGELPRPQAREERQKTYRLDLNTGSWIAVHSGSFGPTVTSAGSPALKCSFRCDNRKTYAMWIFFGETDSWNANKNRARWLALGGDAPLPLNVQDADWRANFGQELKIPREILVRRDLKSGFIGVADVDL